MKKEEYLKKLNDINCRFLELRREKNKLNRQYIQESELQKFKIGEKVVVHKRGKVLYAFVMGMEIDGHGDIQLILNKAKKDGTAAKKLREYYFPEWGDTVEKIE